MWLLNWSFAMFDLQLSAEEFYSLTPRQLASLRKRWERKVEHEEILFAQLGSITANFSFRAPKKPIEVSDLMISAGRRPKVKKKSTRKSNQDLANKLNAIFGIVHPKEPDNG